MTYKNVKVFPIKYFPYELYSYLIRSFAGSFIRWTVITPLENASPDYKKVSQYLLDSGASNGELVLIDISDYHD